jgi:hypothetical protein
MNGLKSIERRMERLERENKRWRMGGVALLVLAAGVAAVPQQKPAPQIVWAQKVVVVDGKGLPRVVSSADAAGAVETFLGTAGRPLMRVGLVGDEPRLETYDVKKQAWRNWVTPGVFAQPIR